MHQWLTACALVFAFTLSTACSHLLHIKGNKQLQAYTLLPESHTIPNVPFFPQKNHQCGSAALATLLNTRGITITTQKLQPKVYIPKKKGAVASEIVAYARQQGLLVYPLQPSMSDLLTEVSANNPVMVLQNLGYAWFRRWHFSVVIGYDLTQQTITLRTGEYLNYTLSLKLFEKTWARANNWAVVMTWPHQLPKTAQASHFLKASHALEQVGEIKAAQAAYQAAIERWPNHNLAYFGAGNTAYALQQYQQSSEFFANYIKQAPQSAAVWNNFAYSLQKTKCYREAVLAIQCALRLSPKSPELMDSYTEITTQQHQQTAFCNTPKCPL